jgi:hypothetical protein
VPGWRVHKEGRSNVAGNGRPATVFPGEWATFAAPLGPGCAGDDIHWTGGGEPQTGRGRRFVTRWRSGGTYTVTATTVTATTVTATGVTATGGPTAVTFSVHVCSVDKALEEAADFYGPSVDMARVTVKASSVIVNGRPWTAGNTVRFPRPVDVESCPDLQTLIHELAHVWEHQNGQSQILSGALEQLGHLLLPGYNPYDFGGPTGVHGARRLQDYSKESQAQIIENYWRSLHGFGADTVGNPFTAGYRADLQRLVQGAGIGTSPPAGAISTVQGAADSVAQGIVNHVLEIFGQ